MGDTRDQVSPVLAAMATRASHNRRKCWPVRKQHNLISETPPPADSRLDICLHGSTHLRTGVGERGGCPWTTRWLAHSQTTSPAPAAGTAAPGDSRNLPQGGSPSPDLSAQSCDLTRTRHWLPGWLQWQYWWWWQVQGQPCWCEWSSTEEGGHLRGEESRLHVHVHGLERYGAVTMESGHVVHG